MKSFEDVVRRDITFINRNRGSGTRVLTDYLLRGLSLKGGMRFERLVGLIKGYRNGARSHSEVAIMIKHGKADLGVGLQASANKHGLDFIPLRNEKFDFIVKKEKLDDDSVKDFIRVLKSKEFKKTLREKRFGIFMQEYSGSILV